MNDNYPDNIRDFDNHPGSPFYEEPLTVCWHCEDVIQEDENHNEIITPRNEQAWVCDYCAGKDNNELDLVNE